jgi:hypothetical protein
MTDWFISPLCAEETCQHLRPEVYCREESPTYSFLKKDAYEYLPFVVEMSVQKRRDGEGIIGSGLEANLYLHTVTCSTGYDWNHIYIYIYLRNIYLFRSHNSKCLRLVPVVLRIILRRDSLGHWRLPELLVNLCSTLKNATYTK